MWWIKKETPEEKMKDMIDKVLITSLPNGQFCFAGIIEGVNYPINVINPDHVIVYIRLKKSYEKRNIPPNACPHELVPIRGKLEDFVKYHENLYMILDTYDSIG